MRVECFADTDALYVILREEAVEETRELNENAYLDLDASGNIVAITLEHAKSQADIMKFSFEQIPPITESTPQ
ncbi:MAG: DUF2283 domain-containing protein [Chloroherpetonaceae bacterium]|nr:DUF2283 domain-containing protein [Chloroherpetonaceae bacterium]MDW8437896.1 DUF2283 domain-containing protein [Chloroherpetonaceae bacterium]